MSEMSNTKSCTNALYVKTLSPECELYTHSLDNYSPLCFSQKMRFICAKNRCWVLDVNYMHLYQTTTLPHLCLKAMQRTCGVQTLAFNVNYVHIYWASFPFYPVLRMYAVRESAPYVNTMHIAPTVI